MVSIYCRGHHRRQDLCSDCQALLDYALRRLELCKFGNGKTSCRKCPVHCYKPEMKNRIRKVMRYSGPRLLLYHPLVTIRHWLG